MPEFTFVWTFLCTIYNVHQRMSGKALWFELERSTLLGYLHWDNHRAIYVPLPRFPGDRNMEVIGCCPSPVSVAGCHYQTPNCTDGQPTPWRLLYPSPSKKVNTTSPHSCQSHRSITDTDRGMLTNHTFAGGGGDRKKLFFLIQSGYQKMFWAGILGKQNRNIWGHAYTIIF